jgi:hypothetical protein
LRKTVFFRNLMEPGEVEALGYKRSEVFKSTYTPMYHGYWVQRCIVFDPYSNVSPSIQGQASVCCVDGS